MNNYEYSIILIVLLLSIYISLYVSITSATNILNNGIDWEKNRCNPSVIPIAGFIKREPDMSITEATNANLKYCTNNLTKNLTEEVTNEFNKTLETANNKYDSISNKINSYDSMLKNYSNIASDGVSYLNNTMVNTAIKASEPIHDLKSKSKKVISLNTILLYSTTTITNTVFTFLITVFDLSVGILKTIIKILVAIFFAPFGWTYKILLLTTIKVLTIPIKNMSAFLRDLGVKTQNVPSFNRKEARKRRKKRKDEKRKRIKKRKHRR